MPANPDELSRLVVTITGEALANDIYDKISYQGFDSAGITGVRKSATS